MIRYSLIVTVGIFLTGCAQDAKLPSSPSLSPVVRGGSSTFGVRALPKYQEAERLVRAGKYREAQEVLQSLLSVASLTQTERDFLKRQLSLVESTRTSSSKISSTKAEVAAKAKEQDVNCGPRALALAAQQLGLSGDVVTLTKVAKTDSSGTSLEGLQQAANTLGLKAVGLQVDRAALAQLKKPAVAWWGGDHFVAVLGTGTSFLQGEAQATIHDPRDTAPKTVPIQELLTRSGGIVLTLERG
jgi:hypothetical protein